MIIRHFESIEDHAKCEQLQHDVWGGDGHLAVNMLLTLQRHGGLAMGAFDERERLLGAVVSFTSPTTLAGSWNGLSQHSHIAAVMPAMQGKGLGEQLKRAQREATLAKGQNLMTWTYDPLESRNANLNLHKLGAIVRSLIPNCYGPMPDELNRGIPSDRFEPEWWLDEETRARWDKKHAARFIDIEIDPDYQAMKQRDLAEAFNFRMRKREEFERAFAKDFVVIDYSYDGKRAAYVLGQFKGAHEHTH